MFADGESQPARRDKLFQPVFEVTGMYYGNEAYPFGNGWDETVKDLRENCISANFLS